MLDLLCLIYFQLGERKADEEGDSEKHDAFKDTGETGEPHFTHYIHGVSVPEGEQVLLSGRAVGKEPMRVTWFLNGLDIEEMDPDRAAHYQISSVLDGLQILCVEECAIEDSGEFLCHVSNPCGQASSSCIVTVIPGRYRDLPLMMC